MVNCQRSDGVDVVRKKAAMLFNSFEFLVFLAVVGVLHFSAPLRHRTWLLLVASYLLRNASRGAELGAGAEKAEAAGSTDEVSAGLAQGYRAPNLDDLANNGAFAGGTELANPESPSDAMHELHLVHRLGQPQHPVKAGEVQ